MEPYVDFFGFMAYDLHGSWDADVDALGSLVRGQADIREISDNTVPLWFDGLNPSKINFGLAMYGRGYTLADAKCNDLLCPFAGPSKPAQCTGFDGVMSLHEIQQLIKQKGLKPKYLPDSMMKQITWDDQWIGYDDEETLAAKKAWADSRCFGGTMVWSIDFQVRGSGVSDDEKYGEVVYVGSEVFQKPTAQCPAPCIMVFPSSKLAEPKTITLPPYTATLEVGDTTTTVVAVSTVRTVIITVINFFNHYVTTSQQPGAALTLRPSFQPPPLQVIVTGADSKTTVRTVLPPPLGGGASSGPSSGSGTNPSTNTTRAISPPPVGGKPTVTRNEWKPKRTEFPFRPISEIPDEEEDDDDDDTPVPVPIPWPSGVIQPVTDKTKPTPPGGHRISCKTWFFWLCIDWIDVDIKVDSWDVVLPPGVKFGPGPPPGSVMKLPTGWRFGCQDGACLPPWPVVTYVWHLSSS